MNPMISIFGRLVFIIAMLVFMSGFASAAAEVKNPVDMPLVTGNHRIKDVVPATGFIQGTINTKDGKPLAFGKAYFFNDRTGPPPAPAKYWRVPDAVTSLDGNGGFSIELPVGSYYIGAIQRKSDISIIGPPTPGDIFFSSKVKFSVAAATTTPAGNLRGAESFSETQFSPKGPLSAIDGVVITSDGKPVGNAIVFAYITPAMNGRPLFVSERTALDGRYHLRVPGNRTYYLRVRDVYGGGMPATGSLMGVFGGETPRGIMVKEGETVKDIPIMGEIFSRPTKTKR